MASSVSKPSAVAICERHCCFFLSLKISGVFAVAGISSLANKPAYASVLAAGACLDVLGMPTDAVAFK